MLFLDGITVSRANRLPDSFCRSLDREAATGLLGHDCAGHTLVEFLNSDSPPCKLYLDRDVYIAGSSAPTPAETACQLDLVHDRVQLIVDRLSTVDNNLSFVVATRHGFCRARGQHKLSFRPFIQGMSIRYTHVPVVINLLGQQGFWDMSVYKAREQLLAAINGCKGLIGGVVDKRILLPEAGEADPLKYVAQHLESDWPFLDVPVKTAAPSAGPTRRKGGRADDATVRRMVACLSASTADDRMKWIVIGMVLKGEGAGDLYYQDWLDFSKRSDKFAGDLDCAKTWAGLRTTGMCGLGTLIYHARRDGYVARRCNDTPAERILRAMKNV